MTNTNDYQPATGPTEVLPEAPAESVIASLQDALALMETTLKGNETKWKTVLIALGALLAAALLLVGYFAMPASSSRQAEVETAAQAVAEVVGEAAAIEAGTADPAAAPSTGGSPAMLASLVVPFAAAAAGILAVRKRQ